jgi:enterochelin esterase-like enzyme
MTLRLILILVFCVVISMAQETKPVETQPRQRVERLATPEVHPDKSVTFRFLAPNAHEVKLELEGTEPVPMQNDATGVWSVTTAPLSPDYYGYSYMVDGVPNLDPFNSELVPNLITPENALHVPGPASLAWELNDVPHGIVHHHLYQSAVAGDERDYYVYTPPGYDPAAKKTYPVLYLLHGFSDDASAWTAVGHANVIFDNLIATGKVKPMIVVMPLGYGTMEVVRAGWGARNHPELRDKNLKNFQVALRTEVMPGVEKEYKTSSSRDSRAIAGLSMGGTESLLTGLNNLDQFAWIGAFSSGGIPDNLEKAFPGLDARANQRISLLWIACGREDRLITANRKFREWLKTKAIEHADIETPGEHTWMVWRRNLAEFAALLFR